ncbi:hypothetical protein PC9H_011169 [Pleurotus ostreatus]|uniref:Uncharacterized protein n=1 Tax=Pleurotus ostreatus TaxID=5322 RepID=A0A8H6ZL83_PLEOS|nr:uncharacterized protein PC9H_011169 [Pleurotus ostreatus]KAF7423005.1 hypothetical protein PC9H_011169 [Pleurotus ostreatus]KAJ8690993.1 putative ATPase [Pleurotus ostreatus]
MSYYTSSPPPQSSSLPTHYEDPRPATADDFEDEEGRDVPSPSEYVGASSTAASTAPSSPSTFKSEDDDFDSAFVKSEEDLGVPDVRMNDGPEFVKDEDKEDLDALNLETFNMKQDDFEKLDFILKKSTLYSSILCERMEENKRRQAEGIAALRASKAQALSPAGITHDDDDSAPRMKGGKRLRSDGDDDGCSRKRVKSEDLEEEVGIFPQPGLITGAKMKNYQLEGLQWMVALHQNGISGILGDEMGLGKTLQTIAFCAYLRELGFSKPMMIVCPLSVLHNWGSEFEKFAPAIPVCLYHGTPEERAELRRTVLVPLPDDDDEDKGSVGAVKTKAQPSKRGKAGTGKGKKAKGAQAKGKVVGKARGGQSRQGAKAESTTGRRRSGRQRQKRVVEDEEEDEEENDVEDEAADEEEGSHAEAQKVEKDEVVDTMSKEEKEAKEKATSEAVERFPVVVTTYEMVIKDRAQLGVHKWGYIVVDEGHRLKNIDCKLIKEIKKYTTAGRMILTGTPLHNNLAELWSLLNFVLPEIFGDLDTFQELFNLPAMQTTVGSERASHVIDSLHLILKPFLLRRMKADVELSLPPKKEYVLYAPLTEMQKDLYGKVLNGGLRAHLIGREKKGPSNTDEETKDTGKTVDEGEGLGDGEGGEKMKLRSEKRGGKRKVKVKKHYDVDGDDEEYFKKLERGELDSRGFIVDPTNNDEAEMAELGREHQHKTTVKQVNNMKLQNTVMQLRKVCSHPFLFDWPLDPKSQQPVIDERLVDCSGKMMVLDRLLTELFKRKHKVLLFSQFTTMLDIIEDWATEFKSWKLCRIDGSSPPLVRRNQVDLFQKGGDGPDVPCLFLLSTRAGGLGINLTAADTVIFYDQDWNPQMDIQAQDRAHRIGQTKPVLIFRLVSAHTIETKIMQRANEKRRLEALVIAKGKFKMPGAASAKRGAKSSSMGLVDMAAELLQLEGEKIEVVPNTTAGKRSVLSDADLRVLLDRRPEVFTERGRGWTSAGNGEGVHSRGNVKGAKTAFAVYEPAANEANEAVAAILGEDIKDI